MGRFRRMREGYNFNGMSDYEIAVYLAGEDQLSQREASDALDAIFRRSGYWNEFSRYVKAALRKSFSITDEDIQDELIQEASIWLMKYLERYGNVLVDKVSHPEKLNFANFIFAMHGLNDAVDRIFKDSAREYAMDSTIDDVDADYMFQTGSSSNDWNMDILMSKFMKKLNRQQAEFFGYLEQGYTLRDIAKEFGKSLAWASNQKDAIQKIYKQYVIAEARRVLRTAIREIAERSVRRL